MKVFHFKISEARLMRAQLPTKAIVSALMLSSLLTSGAVHADTVAVDPNGIISPERTQARNLFKALTSIGLPIDDKRLKDMEALIQAGNARDAVKIATKDPLFYNIKVRDMAKKMSTRDESVRAPLNDFVATFVGVVRDSDTTSAKELLTGNYIYVGDPAKTMVAGMPIPADPLKDIVGSNNHYAAIEKNGFSLFDVLIKQQGQMTTDGQNLIPHPDPAGLLTTTDWTTAHAIAGTNRRMVEYAFREFMCLPMTDWADASAPDDHVGRDVDRSPSGSPNKYLVTCKACHAQMDGLRGAFARVDFNNGMPSYQAAKVVGKYSRNADQFPSGFVTKDDSFINYATVGKNKDQFGWRSSLAGNGIAQFGAMIAGSQGFSRCMVKHIFNSICKRDPNTGEDTMIRSLADGFENSNYNMRGLFETVVLRPECLGTN
jgi:hypothetical protein